MAASSSSRPPLAVAVAVEDERYSLAPSFFSSNTDGDVGIVRHLHGLLELYHSFGHTGVNAGLPLWDPWNIPGMPRDEEEANRREKYYVTDCSILTNSGSTNNFPATQTGYWKSRDLGWGIPAAVAAGGIGPSPRLAGFKTTYDFYVGQTIYQEGSKGTNWIMDVYFAISNGYQLQDDLVMCHVFKGNSRDYDVRPRCAAQNYESPNEKEVHAASNNGLLERPAAAGLLGTHMPVQQQVCAVVAAGVAAAALPSFCSNKHLSPPDHAPQLGGSQLGCVSHHQASEENGEANHQAIGQSNDRFDSTDMRFSPTGRPSVPLTPISSTILDNLANTLYNGVEIPMEMIENDMANGVSSTVPASAENGPLGKRPRTKSDVWNKFTKLQTKAKAVLAVCNHCYKAMNGVSSNGTTHLKRHKCRCNCNH